MGEDGARVRTGLGHGGITVSYRHNFLVGFDFRSTFLVLNSFLININVPSGVP